MFRKLVSISSTLMIAAACVVSAQAAGNVQLERNAIMKNVGAATGVAARMVKGQMPFDAVAAQLAMRTMNSAALGFGYMFPEGTETGSKTRASSKIWSDRAGFDAATAKFVKDTSAKVTDLASLKAAFGAAASNCGSCHKAYRLEK